MWFFSFLLVEFFCRVDYDFVIKLFTTRLVTKLVKNLYYPYGWKNYSRKLLKRASFFVRNDNRLESYSMSTLNLSVQLLNNLLARIIFLFFFNSFVVIFVSRGGYYIIWERCNDYYNNIPVSQQQ